MGSIADDRNVVFVSAVSVWEISIKQAIGKLQIPDGFEAALVKSGFEKLDITFDHAMTAGKLPPFHRDPFDRMLIAQAIIEDLTLLTADGRLREYKVKLLQI
ncbi:MAG: type II toxin-antitoxin system VapC family toxin [Acidimicrobiales bacterium]|nr:type II toxin-antitoxin system VapC family toxin [Acidimicrobiales bacterium]